MPKIATTTTTAPQKLRASLQDYFGGAAAVTNSDPLLDDSGG